MKKWIFLFVLAGFGMCTYAQSNNNSGSLCPCCLACLPLLSNQLLKVDLIKIDPVWIITVKYPSIINDASFSRI
jgi:hypothetical protein